MVKKEAYLTYPSISLLEMKKQVWFVKKFLSWFWEREGNSKIRERYEEKMNSAGIYTHAQIFLSLNNYYLLNMCQNNLIPETATNCHCNCLFGTVSGPILEKVSTRKL